MYFIYLATIPCTYKIANRVLYDVGSCSVAVRGILWLRSPLEELQFFASLFYNFIWHSTFRFLCIAINQMKSTISGIQMLARWLGKLVLELASSAVAVAVAVAATCGDCCSHPSCK